MRHVRVRLERDRRQAEAEIANLTAALAARGASIWLDWKPHQTRMIMRS